MQNKLWKYIVKKCIVVVLTLIIVSLLSFLLMRLSPVDPATAYAKRNAAIVTDEQITSARIKLGLDKPLSLQYLNWVKNAITGEFGISLGSGKPVIAELERAIPVTLKVVGVSAVIMMIGALALGSLGYFLRKTLAGHVLSFLSIIGISIPPFYFAILFIDTFAVKLGIISVTENSGFLRYLPAALCLSVYGIAFYGQMLTSSLIHQMRQDYAEYARCRGFSERRILFIHALPYAVIDLLPSFVQMLGLCLAGAAIVERIFSLPGIGYLIIDSVIKRDSPVIHAAVLFLAFMFVLLDIFASIGVRLIQKNQNTKGANVV